MSEKRLSRSIDTLIKRVGWHAQAGDTAGVFVLVDQVYGLEVAEANTLPEPFRTDFLDNLEFQRFALYNAGNLIVEAAISAAEELSALLAKMTVIEKEDIEQANNVLQQYFFEKFNIDCLLIDEAGREHADWRTMCKKDEGAGCRRIVEIRARPKPEKIEA